MALQNKWKESLRSSIWQKKPCDKHYHGYFYTLFFIEFPVFRIFADKILMEIFPEENPVNKFNSFYCTL